MRVYRQMPAIWNPEFRREFYRYWGKESAVICAQARQAEYPEYRQLLSIKAAFCGTEEYLLGRRQVAVDNETFLIINGDRTYGSRIRALEPVCSFSIFFDRQLVSQGFADIHYGPESLLEDPTRTAAIIPEFSERLYRHDRLVSPVLRYIRNQIEQGNESGIWLEEQLRFLLSRMLRLEFDVRKQQERVNALRASTRREIDRRLARGVDFICTHFRDPIDLRQIAQAAGLSPFYFLRQFQRVYGCSPGKYLQERRCREAACLLQRTSWTMTTIAEHVGYGNRATLYRHIKAFLGVEPGTLRRADEESSKD
jgi:AraC family transcriptional regulator